MICFNSKCYFILQSLSICIILLNNKALSKIKKSINRKTIRKNKALQKHKESDNAKDTEVMRTDDPNKILSKFAAI